MYITAENDIDTYKNLGNTGDFLKVTVKYDEKEYSALRIRTCG